MVSIPWMCSEIINVQVSQLAIRYLIGNTINVDQFKLANDGLGHACGDDTLLLVVGATLKELRQTDIFARLGGDEFGLLLPESDMDSAMARADKGLYAAKENGRNQVAAAPG